MAVPTKLTHPGSPLADCLRKTAFASKKEAKTAAARRTGPTEVYECAWPNPDGTPGTHWHYSRRRRNRSAPFGNAPA